MANRDLTPELALVLGRAGGIVLAPEGGALVVGRDTRVSGPMLESALVAGACSGGVDVLLADVVPTPAVAFLTLEERARGGAVISASHNPIEDNGIKFFSDEGIKIPETLEDAIEALAASTQADLPTGKSVGGIRRIEDAGDRYLTHLMGSIAADLRGLRVVLDCAYGAAWKLAPEAFRRAGADVIALHAEPDGTQINVDCGSTSLDKVAAEVVRSGADAGLAFDGDADRLLAVDESGSIVDGDRILALCAIALHERGELKNDVVVTTVMANLGLRRALEAQGIEVATAQVGDRFVVEEMLARGAVLGGEQSGHIVFWNHSTTGDGILTALQLAETLAASGRALSELTGFFTAYPQILINVPVRSRDALQEAADIWDAVRSVEAALGDDGRVLLRPSGTEQVVRVMVEAADEISARINATRLAETVERALG